MAHIDLDPRNDPSSLFRELAHRPGVFWLDGGGDEPTTVLGVAPSARLSVAADGRVKLVEGGVARELPGPPLARIAEFVESGATPLGGAPSVVGFLAYDLGGLIEPAVGVPRPPAGVPLASLARYDAVLVCRRDFSQPGGAVRVAIEARDGAAAEGLARSLSEPAPARAARTRPTEAARDETRAALAAPLAELPPAALEETPDRGAYVAAVHRVREYIAAGDAYQVNVAQRFVVRGGGPAPEVYLRLRAAQPVPLGCYVDCGEIAVLSNSPERFLRVRGAAIETEPIKGTRPRDGDPVADAEQRESLRRDPKELAEHVMIVDLERSDLGRICTTGSVCVPSLLRVESYATLHHLVSTVRGRLRDGVGLAEILRATFPGGSITGAPKIRAAQIIAEVEPVARGVYTGAIVWFRGPRDFDSAIAIRTAVARAGALTYHVGAGIVADSDPDREHDECLLKARAFLAAVGAGGRRAAPAAAATAAQPLAGASGRV